MSRSTSVEGRRSIPRVNATSGYLLNPLAAPTRSLEGICEVLRLMDYLAVAELHDADRVCRFVPIGDGEFRNPEITLPENPPDGEP